MRRRLFDAYTGMYPDHCRTGLLSVYFTVHICELTALSHDRIEHLSGYILILRAAVAVGVAPTGRESEMSRGRGGCRRYVYKTVRALLGSAFELSELLVTAGQEELDYDHRVFQGLMQISACACAEQYRGHKGIQKVLTGC